VCSAAYEFRETELAGAQAFAALGFWIGGVGLEAPPLALVGMIGFLVGVPVVHAVHHNGFWLSSLAIRAGALGLMFGGAVMMLSACSLFDESCDAGCLQVGDAMARRLRARCTRVVRRWMRQLRHDIWRPG
jgi:hypothetical protein